jgi:hypothetical protein
MYTLPVHCPSIPETQAIVANHSSSVRLEDAMITYLLDESKVRKRAGLLVLARAGEMIFQASKRFFSFLGSGTLTDWEEKPCMLDALYPAQVETEMQKHCFIIWEDCFGCVVVQKLKDRMRYRIAAFPPSSLRAHLSPLYTYAPFSLFFSFPTQPSIKYKHNKTARQPY